MKPMTRSHGDAGKPRVAVNVVVQHVETDLYLGEGGEWLELKEGPQVFAEAVTAISFCIRSSIRDARLVGYPIHAGKERYFYPFGHDPVLEAERARMRNLLGRARRLKNEQKMLRAKIDALAAETKGLKKQFPFPPKAALNGSKPPRLKGRRAGAR